MTLHRIAGEAWAFRTRVEHEAAARFDAIAGALASFDADSPVVEMARRAAEDERRHAQMCHELAVHFGVTPDEAPAGPLPPIAPTGLEPRRALLYEVVAQCCVTETESMATLTELLPRAESKVGQVLRQIARDEVRHSQLGWAHLAREVSAVDVRFLSPALPEMLSGTVSDALFRAPAHDALDDVGLLAHGVLPHRRKRTCFVEALRQLVLPGLERHGVDTGAARSWLSRQLMLDPSPG